MFPLLMQATGAIADHAGPLLAPLFGLISILSFLLIPLELFEVRGLTVHVASLGTLCHLNPVRRLQAYS